MTPSNNNLSWMQEADRFYQEGNYCQALSAYTMILQNDPANPLLLSKKGNTLYMLQEYEAADIVYAEALKISNAVVIVYEYILEYSSNVEANLRWLQDTLSTEYHVDIIHEGLTRVVHQIKQEIIEQANHSTTNINQSVSWKPFLEILLKQLGVPYANLFLGLTRLLQPKVPQKSLGLLQKKPVNRMTWQQFELFLQWFFEQQGYQVQKMKKSYDQGADLILERPGERIVVQAKKPKKTSGNAAVQQVYAARGYYSANHAIAITTTRFSKHAKRLADKLDVELWDWNTLKEKMKTF